MNKKNNKYVAANVILPVEPQAGALLLGDCNSAVDLSILKPHKVMTILSIGMEAKPPANKLQQDTIHHVFDIHDNKQQKLPVELLDQVSKLIEESRKKGGVLVHCYAGVSRSSSFVIAYLIYKNIISYDQAKEAAKKRRPCVHPGDGFIRHLQHYAKVVAQREQDRLTTLNLKEPQPVEPVIEKQPEQPLERTRRGVRGAVKPAGLSSTEDFLSRNKSVTGQYKREDSPSRYSPKIEESPDKLPPIHRHLDQKFTSSSSRVQMRHSIEKIQGKNNSKVPSMQKIYGSKGKVL